MASMDDLLGSLDDQAQQKQRQADKAASSAQAAQNTDKIVGAVDKSTQATTEGLKDVKGEVKVTNPTDVSGVVDSINKLNLTTFMQNEGLPKLAQNLSELSGKTQDLQDKLENEGLKKMSDQLGQVVKKLDEVSKTLSKAEVTVDTKLQKTIDNLSRSIGAIDFKPAVNVSAPEAKVVTTPVDFKPILVALAGVERAVKNSETPETQVDLSSVTSGLAEVRNAITALRFPVPNYVLPFRGIDGKATQVQLDASGNIPTSGGGGGGGGAVTIADGANVAQGAIADAAYASGNGTVVSVLKGIFTKVAGTLTVDTELPAAAALADSTANPTVPGVGNFNHVWGATAATWARQKHTEHGLNTTGTGVATAGILAEFDDVSPTAVTENQFAPVRMSSRREIYGTIRDAAGNERGVNVNASNQLTTADASSSAIGTAVPANATYNGLNPQTALPTAATAGNLTGITADKFGRQVVIPGTIRDLVGTQTTTISASTSETTIVTAAASVFNDLTAIVVSNTSATAARVDFRDTTAGSVLFSLYIPAGDVRGVAFNRPIPQTTVNTNWTAQSSASVTDLRVYAVFDKNK